MLAALQLLVGGIDDCGLGRAAHFFAGRFALVDGDAADVSGDDDSSGGSSNAERLTPSALARRQTVDHAGSMGRTSIFATADKLRLAARANAS